jgi:hypothetical protein
VPAHPTRSARGATRQPSSFGAIHDLSGHAIVLETNVTSGEVADLLFALGRRRGGARACLLDQPLQLSSLMASANSPLSRAMTTLTIYSKLTFVSKPAPQPTARTGQSDDLLCRA